MEVKEHAVVLETPSEIEAVQGLAVEALLKQCVDRPGRWGVSWALRRLEFHRRTTDPTGENLQNPLALAGYRLRALRQAVTLALSNSGCEIKPEEPEIGAIFLDAAEQALPTGDEDVIATNVIPAIE